jgi:hypothetical protein
MPTLEADHVGCRQSEEGIGTMTARLESLAGYIAALIVIKNELSSQEEIREELIQAIEAFNEEIKAARKKRAA